MSESRSLLSVRYELSVPVEGPISVVLPYRPGAIGAIVRSLCDNMEVRTKPGRHMPTESSK